MKIPFFDLKRQSASLRGELQSAMQQVMDSGLFIRGEKVARFEDQWAKALGVEHCVALGNGTDALYVVLKALGVKTGDEVIVPAVSWVSTASVVMQLGAKVVCVDVDEQGLIDVKKVEEKINPRTKAIVPVHLFGQMADMIALRAICDHHQLLLVEDAAQAHLSSIGGKYPGTTSDAATFSFYPTKNLGAFGDAGVIVTRNAVLAQQCRMLANQGGLARNEHRVLGITSRMDELQAAMLLVKLPYLDQWNERRRAIATQYNQQLTELAEILLPIEIGGNYHTYHQYVIRSKWREPLREYLQSEGVSTDVHYPVALPFLPILRDLGYTKEEFPVAYLASQEMLSLPIFPELSDEEVQYVCDRIKKFVEGNVLTAIQ
ncbi:DegT/DnrJ/EryC1/StrS family aminotransferase [Reichenbachiella agarivorans]|uniref:DegT/DnrJ/EryC1/StrS family aminotransferase n=1 Tax=Reichenbachiella agarivorans TaxID=2979464 RepID=A0ABY6CQZ1_9BACT|nr:DegT/DnrJ/EryC1/StrS family aminotransferase [Reichenbachiella agarivorans]UXP32927.1 DegT/DnrJ/EryC1/StrS family aminotransferase [Reichenbachiella agarivorans]